MGFPLYHGTFFWAGNEACGLAPTRVKSSICIRLPCVDGLLRAHAGVDSLAQRLRQQIARDDERAGEDAQHHQKIVVLIARALVAQRAKPGVGEDALDNLLMVLCILSGALVIACNLLAQALSERIDPRMRAQEAIDTWEADTDG